MKPNPNKKSKHFICKDISELRHIAREILDSSKGDRIFAFYGGMGTGKTSLIKEICKMLKVKNIISSPTFSIVNEYEISDDSPFAQEAVNVYHFDFYRIKNKEEIFDIGFNEYLYSGDYCFIEWAEKAEELLPDCHVKIRLGMTGGSTNGIRHISMQKYDVKFILA